MRKQRNRPSVNETKQNYEQQVNQPETHSSAANANAAGFISFSCHFFLFCSLSLMKQHKTRTQSINLSKMKKIFILIIKSPNKQLNFSITQLLSVCALLFFMRGNFRFVLHSLNRSLSLSTQHTNIFQQQQKLLHQKKYI